MSKSFNLFWNMSIFSHVNKQNKLENFLTILCRCICHSESCLFAQVHLLSILLSMMADMT